MSDVADILGYGNRSSSNSNINAISDEAQRIMQGGDKSKNAAGAKPMKKPKGMSREVYRLLGADNASFVPSIQPAAPVVGGFKTKRVNALKGKWLWQKISTSSVPLHYQQNLPYRWVKADLSATDYAYAKFNLQYIHAQYTDEEYINSLQDPQWSREDTDKLIAACEQYDLRWPVIADRVQLSVRRNLEDMQARYFAIKAVLIKNQPQRNLKPRPTTTAATGNTGKIVHDSDPSCASIPMALDDEAAAHTMPLDDLGSFALDGDILDSTFLPPISTDTDQAPVVAAPVNLSENIDLTNSSAAATAPVAPAQIVPLPIEVFDLERERNRRYQQDMLFKRTREDEQEELKLRDELRTVDAVLKKFKKPKTSHHTAPIAGDTSVVNQVGTAGLVRTVTGGIISPPSIPVDNKPPITSKATSSKKSIGGEAKPTSASGPAPGIPALQSTRLYTNNYVAPIEPLSSAVAAGTESSSSAKLTNTTFPDLPISKVMIDKMNSYLRELKIPENPIPTKAVCDSVDRIRRDTIALLMLHSIIKKKEKELHQLRNPNSSGTTKNGGGASSGGTGATSKSASRPRNRTGAKAPGTGKSRPAAKSSNAVITNTSGTSKGKTAPTTGAASSIPVAPSDNVTQSTIEGSNEKMMPSTSNISS